MLIALALRKVRLVKALLIVCVLSLASMFGYRAVAIASDYGEYKTIRAVEGGSGAPGAAIKPVYRLSRSGRNVVVLMLDRGISSFVPFIMKEDSKLAERFRGFVWYPNTLSFNGHTLAAAPALFGGYDYTPDSLNARAGESLVSKHDEALAVMPRLFAEAGWESSISDASWANYSWVPDNSIFSKYPGVQAFNLEGRYTQKWLSEHGLESDPSRKIERNLFWFGLFRLSPMALRFGLYDTGKWWDSRYESDEIADFVDSYAPLDYLPELIEYEDAGNTFNLIVNNVTHSNIALSNPGFTVSRNPIDSSEGRTLADDMAWRIFKVNVSALRLVADFLDALRANDAFDNTMIILTSDHGAELRMPEIPLVADLYPRRLFFTPLLMVKDFGSSEPLSEDRRFRTNADVPAIAAKALGGAANPFTGRKLRELAEGEAVRVVDKAIYDPSTQNRNTMKFDEGDVLTVHGNLFDPSNWSAAR